MFVLRRSGRQGKAVHADKEEHVNKAETRGVLFVHSAPRALCPHIEWQASAVLGVPKVAFDWIDQPASPGTVRSEFAWLGSPGHGAELASKLRGWDGLRYEIAEEASHGGENSRWSHTPELGIFYAMTDSHGNVVISEDRVKAAVVDSGGDYQELVRKLGLAVGAAWDQELEPFRQAGEGAPVRWLHRMSS